MSSDSTCQEQDRDLLNRLRDQKRRLESKIREIEGESSARMRQESYFTASIAERQ